MADNKKITLHSEELGSRDFSEKHAKKLLALQDKLKVSHWSDKKPDKAKAHNEANGNTNTDTSNPAS